MNTENREQLRGALIVFLADRPTRSFSVHELATRREIKSAVDCDFDESHVNDALAMLLGYGLVKKVQRALAGLDDYQATAEGVVFRERQYP